MKRTEAAGVLDEAVDECGLQLEAFLCAGVQLVCSVSSVQQVGSQDEG